MSKKAGHVSESWLIPYADILTLLLALFIVLYASSTLDQAKFQAVMEGFFEAFGGSIPAIESGSEGTGGSFTFPEAPPPDVTSPGEERNPLNDLYASLLTYIDKNGLGDNISVGRLGDQVLITLRSDIWFASGSAEVTPTMRAEAKVLASMLTDTQNPENPFDIVVTGHTDNVPIHTARYPSNWELSMDRAVQFLVVLLSESNLDPTHFSARGYGEYQPIDTNDTPEGRQRNRRVELSVSQPVNNGANTPVDNTQADNTPANNTQVDNTQVDINAQ